MTKKQQKTLNKDLKYGQILGIKVFSTQISEVIARVEDFISHNKGVEKFGRKFYIVTPNPELVLMSQSNKTLKNALNSAALAVPDGIGLAHAYTYLNKAMPVNVVARYIYGFFYGLWVGLITVTDKKSLLKDLNIIKGRVLFDKLVEVAARKRLKVFLLGGLNDEAADTAQVLKKKYKNIKLEYFRGPMLNKKAEPVTEVDKKLHKDAVDKINKYNPDLLFIAFENPKQEIWINKNISKLKIKVAMTVGGTFRYIAGTRPVPIVLFENLEIEWIWRLITEPKRIRRVFNAFPIFPLKVFTEKMKLHD